MTRCSSWGVSADKDRAVNSYVGSSNSDSPGDKCRGPGF